MTIPGYDQWKTTPPDWWEGKELTPEQEAEEAFDEWYGDWLSDMNDDAYEDALPLRNGLEQQGGV